MSVNLEQDLKDILGNIDRKLERIDERLTNLEVGQARLEKKVENLEKDVKELKTSSKAKIWTLIGILGTALLGTVIRYIVLPLPPRS
jgi:uncharacterized protein (DUF3084 family)